MYKDKLFERYPYIETDEIIIRKTEISEFDEWYKVSQNTDYEYTPSKGKKLSKDAGYNVLSKHYDRDFQKHKTIFLGIYLKENDNRLVGKVEIFDVDIKIDMLTIGYTLSKEYEGKGIATKAVAALVKYLFKEINVNRIQAFVMTQNIKSSRVLLKNDFVREGIIREGNYWTGHGIIDLELYSILKEEYLK